MMAMAELEIKDIKLAPGEYYFGQGNIRIHTLLGSCIAITLWHPKTLMGGMCHYLLPARGANKRLADGYFADDVVRMFLNSVTETNTRASEYEVKVFGGGNMFSRRVKPENLFNVSQSNIQAGLDLLLKNGFKIKTSDVGGIFHRKLYIELWNGDVWVQRGRADEHSGTHK